MLLFCRLWMAFVSFRKVRGLIVFLPLLKFMIADLAIPDWCQELFVLLLTGAEWTGVKFESGR